jgi:tetratricopeptide (TPR) repeat protein/tRNA A-37 threonylcarbamoyl transferase component Bud32
MTPTEHVICRLSQELYGLSPEATVAAFKESGAPGVVLVESGLLTAEQADQVLDQAFSEIRAAADRVAPVGPRARVGEAAPEPDASESEEIEGLDELLGRLGAVLNGETPIGLSYQVVEVEAQADGEKRVDTGQPHTPTVGRPDEKLRGSIVGLDTLIGMVEPDVADRVVVSDAAAKAVDAQQSLTQSAFESWVQAEKDVSAADLDRARDMPLSLPDALVALGNITLWEALDALEGSGRLACPGCESSYTISDTLMRFGRDCPCPRCGNELGAPGDESNTVALRVDASTEAPVYASPRTGSGSGRTVQPDYADRSDGRTVASDSARWDRLEAETHLSGGLSNYELLGELARGGMGIVYKARQKALGRIVCLKLMRSAELATADDRRRFLREAEASARLHHPGIVPIHDVGEHNGQCFFSMDFIEGRELGHFVRDTSPEIREIIEIMVLVCDAIHYAHQRGIIHRDLKPANVMVDEDNQPHVMDFGIAKRLDAQDDSKTGPMTQEGEIMGTPHYMAPEQASGKVSEIDVRSDVYSLGVICYELTTGQRPFRDDNILGLIKKVVNDEPALLRELRPDIDPDLETIVLKTMEKDKARRYQTALELKEELLRWLAGEAILARRATLAYRLQKWGARNKGIAISTSIGAFATALVLSLWTAAGVGAAMTERRNVARHLAAAAVDMKAGRYEDAFNRYGRALTINGNHPQAVDGRVVAALRLAEASTRANRPEKAEFLLHGVEHLGVRRGAVETGLAAAETARKRLLELGTQRQRRYVLETVAIVKRLRAAGTDLGHEVEQEFVFDLVSRKDAATVKIMRAVLADPRNTAQVRVVMARALGWLREPSALAELGQIAVAPYWPLPLAYAAADALGWIGGDQAKTLLLVARALRGPEFRRRTQSALRRVREADEAAEDTTGLAAVLARADSLRQVGDHEGAVTAYSEVLETDSATIDACLGRALSLLALSRLAEAEGDLDRVVEAGGPSRGAGLLNRAEARRRQGNVEGALEDLDQLLRSSPKRADAYLARGRIHLAGRRRDAAVRDLTLAVQNQEEYGEAYASLAEARLARGELDEALADAKRAQGIEPERAAFRLVLAGVHFARNEVAEAGEHVGEAITLDPKLAKAYRLEARIALKKGDVDVALRALLVGFSKTRKPSLRLERVRVMLGAKRALAAVAEASMILAEGAEGITRVEALMLRGVAVLRGGDPQAAVIDLREATVIGPQLAAAHYNLACALARADELVAALDALEQAVNLGQPGGPALRDDADLQALHGAPRFERLAEEGEGD